VKSVHVPCHLVQTRLVLANLVTYGPTHIHSMAICVYGCTMQMGMVWGDPVLWYYKNFVGETYLAYNQPIFYGSTMK